MNPNKITIAIAEDHTLVREGLISIINNFTDCQVIVGAENGKDLIDKLSTASHLPDVTIMDISMPELNGYDTIVRLRKYYPSMKFLILTMFDKEYSIIKMIKNGANGYLLKANPSQTLHQAIVDIHTKGYYYGNTASEKAFELVKNNHLPDLTEKELQFLKLSCSEMSYTKIAEIMHISVRTVEGYQKSVSEKLSIHTRVGLALFAVRAGLVSLNTPTG